MTQLNEEHFEVIDRNKDRLYQHNKILDKLEQRISKLEKVLASHAKCIGELRGTELRIHDLNKGEQS
jgi:hypothetical protein